MSLLPAPQTPSNKRYWGEERNIDSIYSIYLKKISYTYNNNPSPSELHRTSDSHPQASHLDESASQGYSSNTLNSKSSNKNNGNCHKSDSTTPRSRKNFFQRYRRRSCSIEKCSSDKQPHSANKKASSSSARRVTDMLYLQGQSSARSSKDSSTSQTTVDDHQIRASHDELDGNTAIDTNGHAPTDDATTTTNNLKNRKSHLYLSTSELSSQSSQSLQWETRQVKVLQAATLDHVLKFILLINPLKDLTEIDRDHNLPIDTSTLEEERNNVAHIIHVLFCTYRIYTNPYELMLKLMDYSDLCRIEQYRFVMHYWMDNYPEDFDYTFDPQANSTSPKASSAGVSHNDSITSYDSTATSRTAATSSSEMSTNGRKSGSHTSETGSLDKRLANLSIKTSDDRSSETLIHELFRLCKDDYIRDRAVQMSGSVSQSDATSRHDRSRHSRNHSHNSQAVLDLDSRYVAQQLTAIDLENFLNLRPYSLLEGTKSDQYVQRMIKNFNLLSRHVVITILKSHSPHIVSSHWIAIAMNLRKIKNFNSLKAIIAGLTNESIYRLKQTIWTKIDRNTMSNFKVMAAIVDDVNNQTVLRQTQLVVEGTAKMSVEDDSFGTIPYLGTFLTDLNMIDARYQSYVPSPKDATSKLKLINFEKCARQFEIITQVQLLQKNVLASLHALQRRHNFDEQTTLNRLKQEFSQNQQMLLAKPAIPRVSRLFENWFYDSNVTAMTDKQCYDISVSLEANVVTR